MCGIVGYLGNRTAEPLIISGLEKLEYRGYDSAGIALYEDGKISVTRALGKLGNLKKLLQEQKVKSNAHLGIGHTRWATHGRPSENNAHPHTVERVSLIHNGIIENYAELKKELLSVGAKFNSDTDTEIVAHLLNKHLRSTASPFEALKKVCSEIRGSYAFVAFDAKNPDRLLVAKNATPIIIGKGEGEVFVASDIPAVLEHTRNVMILEDGDLAEVSLDEIHIENGGKTVDRPVQRVTWDPVTAQKGGYAHFMLKEIHEQSQAVADTIRGRVNPETGEVKLEGVTLNKHTVENIKRIILVACGTAWHACLVGKFYLENSFGIPCEVDYASEFRYRTPLVDKDTLVIAISQSGETADTLGAIETVRGMARTFAICNVVGSSLTRRVDHTLYTHAGPEISVASTKAFTTQLAAVYLLAQYLSALRPKFASQQIAERTKMLLQLPAAITETFKVEDQIQKLAKQFGKAKGFLFTGRGICYPLALEGALKLKEISYIHAEGYPAGELKHGPIALIDENMPVVVVLHKSDVLYEKAVSNLREVESRGGQIIAVTDHLDRIEDVRSFAKEVIAVPHLSTDLSPVLLSIPLQLLAYYIAVANGTDVDQPRNLAKSVTVE